MVVISLEDVFTIFCGPESPCGVFLKGNYDLPESVLKSCLHQHAKHRNGLQLLREYAGFLGVGTVAGSWCPVFDAADMEICRMAINRDTFWDPEDIFSHQDWVKIQQIYLSQVKQEEMNSRSYQRRKAACNYTARKSVRNAVFARDGKMCAACGSIESLQLDHLVPVSKGGRDELDNLQVLCRSCNSSKCNKIPEQVKQ